MLRSSSANKQITRTQAADGWETDRAPACNSGRRAMLQNLSEEIREYLSLAEECKQRSKIALSTSVIKEYLEMEQRWLNLARSYEFAERLSRFTEPYRREQRDRVPDGGHGSEGHQN